MTQNNITAGRIQEVDSLRGFAICLVIFGHAISRFPIDLLEIPYCRALFSWQLSVHMPLFFIISGFCYSHRDYKTYMSKKISRLLVPYIIFSILDMIPRQLLASLVRRPRPITESIIDMLF